MKKQSVLALALVIGLAGGTSFHVQAAAPCSLNEILQSKNCNIANVQRTGLPDVNGVLEDLCNQLQNGNCVNGVSMVVPDCNRVKGEADTNCSNNTLPNCDQVKGKEDTNCSNNASSNCNQVKVGRNSDCPSTNYNVIKNISGKNFQYSIVLPNCNNTKQTDTTAKDVEETTATTETGVTESTTEVEKTTEQNLPNANQSTENQTTEESQTVIEKEALSYAERIVELVNAERAKVGIHALRLDNEVTKAAGIRVKEIQTSFSHTRPDGRSFSSVLTDNGIRFTGAGENIAWGQRSPEEVMQAWMNSDGHRANILNARFTKIGVGHYQDASFTY